MQWLHEVQGHSLGTTSIYLNGVSGVVRWLRARRIQSFSQLTLRDLQAAHHGLSRRDKPAAREAARALEMFLRAEGALPEGETPLPSPSEAQWERFATFLREVRGLSDRTLRNHRQRLMAFLKFLHFDQGSSRLSRLESRDIESFLGSCGRTNSRFSLQHFVATLRAFLQWRYGQGLLAEPLHERIDTPRVYRGERLPRAIPWEQVQALLASIDRCDPRGQRDFALLYLAAAYGLRCKELVTLRLEDIDWPAGTLRIRQSKTRQPLLLPLSAEAAGVIIEYLRQGRPHSAHRELFLRATAPRGPMGSTAVRQILAGRVRRSGLDLPGLSPHGLRHSFAMRLLQEGVPCKAIGDALGHRDIESTSIYLRLDVDYLREAAQPVPLPAPGDGVAELVEVKCLPRIRSYRALLHLPPRFQSWLAPSLQRYLDLKRALGRIFVHEASVLGQWDDFLHREYPRARAVRAAMFARWSGELGRLNPTTSRRHQSIVRNFLLFHARDHGGTFVPDPLTFPKPAPTAAPRLVSEAEMGRLLDLARTLPPTFHHPLRAETIRIGLILLFCCGLRRGELLRLRLGDIEAAESVLHIRLTKFHKSRLVPLSASVSSEIEAYLRQRRGKSMPMAAESFLMWSPRSGEVYRATQLASLWHQLCASAGVLDGRGRPPRLHDLRHSFAVNALQRWYAQGADVHARLPRLATYLGHTNAASTHYYLKLTPALRESASELFHQRFATLFTEGGLAR